MKKIILSLAVVLSSSSLYAQTNTFPSNGNVGIGTTSPAYSLDVAGDIRNSGYFHNSNGNYWFLNGATGAANIAAGGVSITNNYNTLPPSNGLYVQGNVGIGTTTPSTSLDVAGVIQIAGVSSNTPPAGLSYGLFGYVGIGLGIFSGAMSPNQGIGIWTAPGGVKTEVMRILSGGNVGIGTTQPDQKLTVNGTIHSTEVKVTPTVPVPDYVFEPTYKLINLTELKSYLDANHHLPEIPSAVEIEKNDLNLGEMNLRLLKKVEELTLYVIEKDKQFNDLQKQIDELKEQLKASPKN